jgi:DNA-binding NtrC family response regulator
VTVDVRVIAATNRDLDQSMQHGTFRPDLYFRLNVVAIHLPPLRERRDDLPLLIRHFLERKAAELGVPERSFNREAFDALLAYHWPGNVRELENLVERALALAQGDTLTLADLPPQIVRTRASLPLPQAPAAVVAPPAPLVLERNGSLSAAVEQLEMTLITDALTQAEHNQTRAAEILGTTRRILKYKMDKLGIASQDASDLG